MTVKAPQKRFSEKTEKRKKLMTFFNPETETDPDRKLTFEQKTKPDPDRSQKVKPAGLYDVRCVHTIKCSYRRLLMLLPLPLIVKLAFPAGGVNWGGMTTNYSS
jgi:hypothetical protein